MGRHYLQIVHPEDRFRLARFYTGQAREFRTTTYCEFQCITQDGSVCWIGQNVRVISEGGRILGFHAVARDITAVKEAESACIARMTSSIR
jgi:PAS domain S-box-containing protein